MSAEDMTGQVEAILFASGEPMSLERIAQAVGMRTYAVESAVAALQEKYNKPDSGVHLLMLGDSAQFCTNPAFIGPVRAALDLKRNTPLSQAAMEVLAVVAYNQPVTKAFVEQVRGVDCSGVVGSLVQKGLLEERGRLELPGRPLLYGTTENFLRCFQLESIDRLPPPPGEGTETGEKAGDEDGEDDEPEQITLE